MALDVAATFQGCEHLAERMPNKLAAGLKGSEILKIAAEVDARKAAGAQIANFTIGDFDSKQFPIPPALEAGVKRRLAEGHTSYPPAVGVAELRRAIATLYERDLGLKYPDSCIQVGSGARPPLWASFATVLEPGDLLVYPVPSWNNNHYAYLNQARVQAIATRPENGFMPCAEEIAPFVREARMIALCSPLNPSGTVIREGQLRDICTLVVDENHRREKTGERPLVLLYDQVYWQLTFGEARHFTPVGLVPEMAKYTMFVDAISKCWAATGLRVGWAVVPPWMRNRMQPLIGHVGAWAPRPEQLASAELLEKPELTASYMIEFKGAVQARLDALHAGFQALKAEGLPCESLVPQGAIYLTAKVDIAGRTLRDGRVLEEEGVRRLLLEECDIAVVPFSAFGLPPGSNWMRFSVGSVSLAEIERSFDRLRSLLLRVL